jgi:hypothetical protein
VKTKTRVRDAATGRVIDVDEDEWLEFCRHKGILRDGQSVRIPVTVMDAAGRELPNWVDDEDDEDDEDETLMAADGGASLVEDETCYVTDAFGRPAGRRPGYAFAATDVAQDAIDDAYAAHDVWLRDAWRSPGSGARVAPALGARVAAGSAQDALERAYDEHDKLLTNAWRGNKALRPGASARAVADPDAERRRAFNPEVLPPVVTAHVAAPARGNNSNNADPEDPYEAHKRLLSNAWRNPGPVVGPWGAR